MKDHYHFSGKFRSFAHKKCNFKIRLSMFTPVLLCNSKNYDIHLFVKEIRKYPAKLNIIIEKRVQDI